MFRALLDVKSQYILFDGNEKNDACCCIYMVCQWDRPGHRGPVSGEDSAGILRPLLALGVLAPGPWLGFHMWACSPLSSSSSLEREGSQHWPMWDTLGKISSHRYWIPSKGNGYVCIQYRPNCLWNIPYLSKKVLVARGGGENHLLDYMVVGTQSFCRQSFFAEARLLFADDFFPAIIIILVAVIIINPFLSIHPSPGHCFHIP